MSVNGNTQPGLLVLTAVDNGRLGSVEGDYRVVFATAGGSTAGGSLEPFDRTELEQIEAIITNGGRGLSGAEMQAMPRLRFIQVLGSGTDKLDIDAAAGRGIVVASGVGSNAPSVADHAIGMALAILRDIPRFHIEASEGTWTPSQRPTLSGKVCGILGLGAVGEAIARRLIGFDARIAYHNRRAAPGSPYAYCGSPAELAAEADVLFVCCPGGAATYHLVDTGVLNALGSAGFLVNVGRGTVVDSDALAAALMKGAIAGAAIDVFEGEPLLPDVLRTAPNLVVTPHVAGLTSDALDAAWARARANLRAFRDHGEIVGRLV
ncbi:MULTISPECIES: NAD(P)-dependent oxidoreductase [Chelativorans]|jgi:lactate dehydrogenase-like 2-hydroxyacid dehydrogenase|uniref:D-isomer specific 2-hydroxyacid dehydrogenase, NAD-binding protein n=1 Tax=Chelativorans sp. (strain BNC1) TaxID=266779 RepID=Q11AM6_CHESB|nr:MULTISPECIES: NAD(P)-dependent oxidoreductase [Chelativorans]